MNRYNVWVIIINKNNKPQMKKGLMLSEFDSNHDNIKIDDKVHKVDISMIFDSMQECLKQCKELDKDK